ncbi:MAG: hypothetical protein ACTSU4_03560 [Promethearchaeota archaeon]
MIIGDNLNRENISSENFNALQGRIANQGHDNKNIGAQQYMLTLEEKKILIDRARQDLTELGIEIIDLSQENNDCMLDETNLILIGLTKIEVAFNYIIILLVPIISCIVKLPLIIKNDRIKSWIKKKEKNELSDLSEYQPLYGVFNYEFFSKCIGSNLMKIGNSQDELSTCPKILKKLMDTKKNHVKIGAVRYIKLTCPILLTLTKVNTFDARIPFSYQRNSNLHVIEINQLKNFLKYLLQEIQLHESLSQRKILRNKFLYSYPSFLSNIRYISVPILALGIIYFILLRFNPFFISSFFNTFIGILLSYCLLLMIFLFKHLKIWLQFKKILLEENLFPNSNMELKQEDIYMLQNELPEPLLSQFLFEIGKSNLKKEFFIFNNSGEIPFIYQKNRTRKINILRKP